MFDARDLLGKLAQSGMGANPEHRLNNALGGSGSGAGGLGQLLGGLFGPGGQLGGLGDQAKGAFGTARSRVEQGDPLAIGGLGALAGLLLGGRTGAVGGGVLGALGALAYSMMQKSATSATPQTPEELAPMGLSEPQTPEQDDGQQHTALLVIRAMVNAAKADGQVDGAEITKIIGKLDESGADADAKAYVMDLLSKPMETDAIVRDVPGVAQAIEVYAASLLAIAVDTPAETDYLKSLAAALNLMPDMVAEIHSTLGVPPLSE